MYWTTYLDCVLLFPWIGMVWTEFFMIALCIKKNNNTEHSTTKRLFSFVMSSFSRLHWLIELWNARAECVHACEMAKWKSALHIGKMENKFSWEIYWKAVQLQNDWKKSTTRIKAHLNSKPKNYLAPCTKWQRIRCTFLSSMQSNNIIDWQNHLYGSGCLHRNTANKWTENKATQP